MNKDLLFLAKPILEGLRGYHHHEAFGLEKFPKSGPVIVAANHSLASYDISLLMTAIFDETGRIPRALIDHLFFKIPGLGELMQSLGSEEGTPQNALKLLSNGEVLVLAPGGMRESLRPMQDRYKILWDRRKGFIKMSIDSGAPIVLAACPKADDLYDVMPSYVTAWVYKRFKIPLPIAKGIGLSPLPKPVQLIHCVSEPIAPPVKSDDPEVFKDQITSFHREIVDRMTDLMAEALRKS
jgi:1-acyl-sn-glycerol-3-phosphate acyltransferase